jgi:putative copper resistance protein D
MNTVLHAGLRALVFLGIALVLGSGIFARWISPETLTKATRRYLRLGLWIGCGFVIVGSFGEIAMTVTRILRGRFATAVLIDYLLTTRHGQATLVRSGLVVLLGVWGMRTLQRRFDRLIYAVLGLSLLATISIISHSGTMGTLPFLGDLAHLVGTALWGGGLLYLAWVPIWQSGPLLKQAVGRVSTLGVISVIVLISSGSYMGALHLYGLGALTETSYGLSLSVKLMLVLMILTLAGLNRWLLVPLLERRAIALPLKRAVRLESVLLAAVLVTTGVLTTREPAHDHGAHGSHMHHEQDGHTHTETSTDTPPHHLTLEAGTLIFSATEGGNLALTTESTQTSVLSLEAFSPTGDFGLLTLVQEGETQPLEAVTLQPQEIATISLPSDETGIWQLLGELDGELFELSVTVERAVTPSGLDVTLLLIPTPSLSGGGRTQAFVSIARDGEPVQEPVSLNFRMPDMVHASDGDEIDLEADSGSGVQSFLTFPMTGIWELTLRVNGETVMIPIEMVSD